MDTTMSKNFLVPECFRELRSLERQAYEMALERGYALAIKYLDEGVVLDEGKYPPVPPEFQGRELAQLAWVAGCVDGGVRATRNRMALCREDMIADTAAILDELDRTDPVPVFVGKELKSPSELQNERRAEWMAAAPEPSESQRRQAEIDAAALRAEARAETAAKIFTAILFVVLVGGSILLLAAAGCAKTPTRYELPHFSKN